MELFFEKLLLIKNKEENYSCYGVSPLLNKDHEIIGKIKIEAPNCVVKNGKIIALPKGCKNDPEISKYSSGCRRKK